MRRAEIFFNSCKGSSLFPFFAGQAHAQCVPDVFPDRWLQAQEALGVYTIARHVGKTDAWLVIRLLKSSRISAASSYPNIETATTHIQSA